MARRNESTEDKKRRELVQGFLKDNPINDPNDIQELMKEMMRQVLQGGLEAELDDELGYTRYDYRNKETENSRNGFSKKTMHTSIGDMEIDVPQDRQGEFEHTLDPEASKYPYPFPGHRSKDHLYVCQGNDCRRYREAYP